MGTGKVALQLFLQGHSVHGVELAPSRYRRAAEALQRLKGRYEVEEVGLGN